MDKTPFSGITALGPNESIYSDNSAFIERDRFEIDRELELGVKTHRHTGLSGLHAPLVAPSGVVVASGGSIPGGLSLSLAVTYLDLDGGETLVSPAKLVTTPSPVQAPTVQLGAVVEYTAGSLDVDTFTYAFTYLDSAGGETPLSPATVVARQPGFGNAQVVISGQAPGGWPDPSIIGARLYRARAGGEYVFLTELDEEPFTDDGSVSPDCDRHPPSFNVNTTGGANQLTVTLPHNPAPGEDEVELAFINLYCSQSGNFDESCLVGRFPTGSGGATTQVLSLDLLEGQPPDVNRSFGGASPIDPDTELLDWHWKRPVATEAALPVGAEDGDARVVIEDGSIWVFTESEWHPVTGGGGGGSGSSLAVFLEGAHHGTEKFEDDFGGGDLDEKWEIFEDSEPLSNFWVEEGGKIQVGGPTGTVFGVEAADMTTTIKFGGTLASYCDPLAVLRVLPAGWELFAGYQGGIGHGFGESAKLIIELKANEPWTLVESSLMEPPAGEYWVRSSIKGTVVTVEFFDADPAGGAEPTKQIECDLTAIMGEPGMPSVEEVEPFFPEANLGVAFVGEGGAEGAFLDDVVIEYAVEPSADYIAKARYIEFRSGATLAVGSGAGSGAIVTIPEGGAGGSVSITGSGDIFVTEPEENQFLLTVPFPPAGSGVTGSGLTSVTSVGSSWVATGRSPTRVTGSAVSGSLIAGGAENLDFVLRGSSADLIRLITDHKARVRVYGDSAARTADAAREIGVDPTGDHGVQLDYANNLEAGGGKRRLTPIVNAANLDEPSQHRLYLRVTNLEATTQTITIAFTYLVKEA